ncbi:hypothetical protein [Pantoea vagans]|uniref:hypothetical protein n=1 Tax=Pantoea vagans TaxID=470934 RepID=UPI0023B13A24|nr:hypothetical protein [Pantoea vagans]MDE8557943.1 hypothetical protein [Pantoea vagans]MDE8577510.1 hypothetical protein [Pantoea vagans]
MTIVVLNAGCASTDSDEPSSRLSVQLILFDYPFTVNSFPASGVPFLNSPGLVSAVEHILSSALLNTVNLSEDAGFRSPAPSQSNPAHVIRINGQIILA